MIDPRQRHFLHLLTLLATLGLSLGYGAAAESAPDWIARIDSLKVSGLADSALSVIARALPVAETSADSTLLLGLWVRQGELLTSLGFAREGEEVLRKARSLAIAHRDSARICVAMRWLSVAVGSQGREEEAVAICRNLLSLAQTRRDRLHEAWARVGIAWGAETAGHDDQAMEQYRLAVELFRGDGNQRGEAWAQNGLGNALAIAGRYDEARQSYRDAERIAEKIGYGMVEGLAANNLGTLEYSLGDPAAAVDHFRQALLIRHKIGSIRERIIPGINFALCNAELGRLDEASDSLEAMLVICRAGGYADLQPKVINQLAETRVLQGRSREARSLYRSTIAMGTRAPMKNRVDAVAGLSELLQEADSTVAALRMLEQALVLLDEKTDPTWRMRIDARIGGAHLDLRDAPGAIPHLKRAAEAARRLRIPASEEQALIDLGRAWRAIDRPDSALAAWVEATHLWETVRGAPTDPEWREVRGGQARSLCTDLTSLILETDRRPDRVRVAYDRAQRFKTRTLIERIQGPATDLPSLEATVTLDQVQTSVLGPNEALLDYFLGPRVSYLFAVTRDSCRVIVLPPEKAIASMVLLYHDLLRTPTSATDSPEAIDEAGRNLAAVLLADTQDMIRTHERIYVSPDGVLNLIPFDPQSSIDTAESEWIRVPSATVLDLLRARALPATKGPARILAFADAGGPSGRLRGVREEVQHLARHYRGTDARLLTPEDTFDLTDLGAARSVLHIASHSDANDQRPWLSKIELGGAGVRADQIAGLRLPVRLAVLSSCQTQHGRVLSGEGTLGLSTALLCAGSDCVVATLWPVDDHVTASFMRCFYGELSGGRSVARAIRKAQEEIRGDVRTSHPFYWAGFVAIGRGEVVIPLRARSLPWTNPASIIALGALLAVGALVGVQRIRRGRPVIREHGVRLMG